MVYTCERSYAFSTSKTLTSNSYDSRNRLTSALYGNGQRVNYKYDSLDRPVIKYYNNDNPNNAGYHTVYNANGLVGLHKDVVNTQRTRYTYDLAQRLVRVRRNVGVLEDNGAFLAELAYTYENNTNRLSAYTLELLLGSGTSKVKTSFTYGNKNGSQMTDAVYEVRQNGGLHKTYTYDGLGRKTQTMMSMGGANKPIRYTYVGVKDNRTTTMLESLDNFGEKLSYTYDDNGNIETIRKNGVLQETYHYDVLNQLVRADSAAQNKSFVYAYDAGGNILSVKEYAYTTGALGTAVKTTAYGYTDGTWKDLLTSYAGQSITYDGIGNPLSYRDGLSMTWRNGRELASLTKNGVTASYLYDESGLRTKKTVGGVVTNYHVINGVLYGEYTGSHRLLYMFDEAGTRYSFLYNGGTYYYVFNGQGDVIGITDGYGNMLARYTYDAWGKPLTITDGAGNDISGNASHIANVNPFRYRGYYYDAESGLYYLQSRYYDPQTGRFINADGVGGKVGELGSHNIFAYCENNPIHRFDPIGQAWYDAICRGISTVLDMIFPGSKARAEKMMNSPSPYDCVNYITSGFADTAKGAFFPEEPLSAQHWVDSAATAAVLVGLGAGASAAKMSASKMSNPKISTPKNSGVPFKTGQRVGTVQVGVDPNTLKINRRLLPEKMKAIEIEARRNGGINRMVQVYSDGLIYDGNHRAAYGRKTGGAVDTIVIFK